MKIPQKTVSAAAEGKYKTPDLGPPGSPPDLEEKQENNPLSQTCSAAQRRHPAPPMLILVFDFWESTKNI